jgi:FlaA1/EpsC-like NDP-sugar epimerase
MNGEFSAKQIAPVAIEELLQRDPINLTNAEVSRLVRDKVILVTGAAGSIGSELVNQLGHYSPAQLICIDQAETPLHDLQLSLTKRSLNTGQGSLHYYVADITDTKRMRQIIRKHRPQMIFHAAAYKHVPLMEENPMEAVRVNILGTSSLLHLAREYGVARFVMVSTDKAVNPTNVMGASKRMAEIIAQAMADAPGFEQTMDVVTTRFGNVLGSNGSVIPLFKRQLEAGGPITVTHPEITRYFMTIPEACQLVLEAATMGQGGEIYVFDMGEPVKIADLAGFRVCSLARILPSNTPVFDPGKSSTKNCWRVTRTPCPPITPKSWSPEFVPLPTTRPAMHWASCVMPCIPGTITAWSPPSRNISRNTFPTTLVLITWTRNRLVHPL